MDQLSVRGFFLSKNASKLIPLIFNALNLAPFGSHGSNVFVTHPNFGEATGALAGRVIELQVRSSF